MITSFIGQNSVPITRTFILRHNRLCPAGAVSPFAGAEAPDGWLMCDGSEVSIETYNKLYNTIGATYGAATAGYFKLPDMRSKFPLAAGDGPGSSLSNRVLGQTGGEENHTLIAAEMPSHSHGVTDPGHTHTYSDVYRSGDQSVLIGTSTAADQDVTTDNRTTGSSTTGISIQNTGGGQAHNTMPPFLVLNYIIKY